MFVVAADLGDITCCVLALYAILDVSRVVSGASRMVGRHKSGC
jgi:hypothetical protein